MSRAQELDHKNEPTETLFDLEELYEYAQLSATLMDLLLNRSNYMEVTPSQPTNCPKCGILMPEPQLKWCPGPSLGNMTKCEHNQRTEHLYQLCPCGYPARIEYVKDHPHDALTDKRKLV